MSEHNQEGAARETAYDVSRPHDSLFRGVFSDQAAAVGLLRGYLPESVGVRLRWSTLSLQNTSFVDPELRDSAADLLYEIRQHSGRRLWLYVLLEHQSEPDRWMRWRLLRYCCRIWERDRTRNRRRLSLRPIVPMVLYHGPRRWSWPREFAELFPAGMQQWSWLPHWEHLLIDLGALGPERVQGELKGRIAQLSMIAAYRDARRILRDVLPLLGELYRRGEVDDFGRLVLYIYATQKEEIREQFAQGLHRQVPGSGGEVMNYLEQLVEQGRQAGRRQGVRQDARKGAGRAPGRGAGNHRAPGARRSRVEHHRIGHRDRSRSPADTETEAEQARLRQRRQPLRRSERPAIQCLAGRASDRVSAQATVVSAPRPPAFPAARPTSGASA